MLPLRDENPTLHRSFVTYVLIAINVLVFLFPQGALDPTVNEVEFIIQNAAIPCEIKEGRGLTAAELEATFNGNQPEACDLNGDAPDTPYADDKNVWLSVIYSMFMHGGWLHLGGNMLFLWIFGNNIEDRLGHVRYLAFYLLGGIAATVAHMLGGANSTIPIVGASGAIAAVMGCYLVWYPMAPIRTLIIIFLRDLKAVWVLGFWFVSQFFIDAASGVAWLAHVGGFVFGVGVGLAIRALPALRRATMVPAYRDLRDWDNTGGIGTGPYPHAVPVYRR